MTRSALQAVAPLPPEPTPAPARVAPSALVHGNHEKKTDEELRREAAEHLAGSSALQVMADALILLRVANVPWWSPEQRRERYGAATRMKWLTQRADIRQEITTALCGLPRNTARKRSPEFQAELIDSVLEDSDSAATWFEGAFDPRDLVVYGPVASMWREIIACIPWEEEERVPASLIEQLLGAFIADKSHALGLSRAPLLEGWELRAAIDGRIWHSLIPLDLLLQVDEARLRHERERPNVPFRTKDELAIVTPRVIASYVPLSQLQPVFIAAGEAMGIEPFPAQSQPVPAAS